MPNKNYTCHNCSTVHDVWPDEIKNQFEATGQPMPAKVKVKCPGCYDSGYTTVAEMIYTLDITTDPPTLA